MTSKLGNNGTESVRNIKSVFQNTLRIRKRHLMRKEILEHMTLTDPTDDRKWEWE